MFYGATRSIQLKGDISVLQAIESEEEGFRLEQQVLEKFGKPFYKTKHLKNVRRRFHLTRVTLGDIMSDCGVNAKPEDCRARLFNAKSEIQFPLAGRRLVRFTAVARHGRFLIMQKERDPSFFITLETILFARRVHWYLTRVHEDA